MQRERVYLVEKAFGEIMRSLDSDNLIIRKTTTGKYVISLPHPSRDMDYVLCTYERKSGAREFTEMGTCVLFAINMGADSITFRLKADTGSAE